MQSSPWRPLLRSLPGTISDGWQQGPGWGCLKYQRSVHIAVNLKTGMAPTPTLCWSAGRYSAISRFHYALLSCGQEPQGAHDTLPHQNYSPGLFKGTVHPSQVGPCAKESNK